MNLFYKREIYMRITENRLRRIIRSVIAESYGVHLSDHGYYNDREMKIGYEVEINDIPSSHMDEYTDDLVGMTGIVTEMDPVSRTCVVELSDSGRSISLPCHEKIIDLVFSA